MTFPVLSPPLFIIISSPAPPSPLIPPNRSPRQQSASGTARPPTQTRSKHADSKLRWEALS